MTRACVSPHLVRKYRGDAGDHVVDDGDELGDVNVHFTSVPANRFVGDLCQEACVCVCVYVNV